MKGIKIYVEGGGDSKDQKRELRIGFDRLRGAAKAAAQAKRLTWDSVFYGGRQQTFDAFRRAINHAEKGTLLVLLVDSENRVAAETKDAEANAKTRVQHLAQRPDDQWDLSGVPAKQVHLMVQCMEAWIVADSKALASFYGKGFHSKSLPQRQNLEEEPKTVLLEKLKKATNKTQKGPYAKIKHASKLLERINPTMVGKRCCRFSTFTAWLTKQIKNA